MPIRAARASDVPEILRLIHELAVYEQAGEEVLATEEQLTKALFGPAPAAHALIAEHPGDHGPEVAGFALWFLNFSTWLGTHGVYLEDLYVRPGLRAHGYGRALLAELARICAERGYGRLEWAVLNWNEPAIGFYRRLGATAQDEWTVYRVDGDALRELGSADQAQSGAPVPGSTGRG